MSRHNRDRKKKNLTGNAPSTAHVGGIAPKLNLKLSQTPPRTLPIISPHDIRRAPEGTVSGEEQRPILQMMAVGAMLHTEPASITLPPVTYTKTGESGGAVIQHWECPPYYGLVRRYLNGFPIGGGPFAVLSVSRIDENACRDWRDFQQLKNQIVGAEWEAVELFPAESRLLDPSNRYYLWCCPKDVFVFGMVGRSVKDAGDGIAPQRPFPRATEGSAE